MPAIRGSKSNRKTRRRRRDLDQIHTDMRDPKHLSTHKDSKAAEDLPALGEFYCVECAKWFESKVNMLKHAKGKPHKRRLRQLKEDPYTQREAEAAVGLTTDVGKQSAAAPEEMAVDDVPQQDPAAALVPPAATTVEAPRDTDADDDEEYNAFFDAYKTAAMT